jgi:hypothetical protein
MYAMYSNPLPNGCGVKIELRAALAAVHYLRCGYPFQQFSMYRRLPHPTYFESPSPQNVSPLGRGDPSIWFFVKDKILFFYFALIASD